MLKSSNEIRDEISELRIKAQAIVDLAKSEERELSEEEQKSFDQFADDADGLEQGKLQNALKREDLEAKARQAHKLQARVERGDIAFGDAPENAAKQVVVPARAQSSRKLHCYENQRDAYVAGNVILAGLFGNESASRFCDSQGLRINNSQNEGSNIKGGFLVPDEMERSLVRLREERGVFPQYARSYPMASDSVFVPRDIADVSAYWVGEESAITESDKDIGGAELIAKKVACLTKVSSELDEDSVVDVAEMITRSMAYAMADKIDEAGFNGDGSSSYGGVTGLKNALNSAAIQDAASGNTGASTLDLADFENVAGLLPQYAGASPVWFVHSSVYYASMCRLMNAAGGTTGTEIANGTERRFLGFPVVFAQVLPSETGASASSILCYLGDLSLAATVGNRRNVRTQVSVDRYFENDLIGIKCTERVAINVHERGDSIRTRPIVALKTAAS